MAEPTFNSGILNTPIQFKHYLPKPTSLGFSFYGFLHHISSIMTEFSIQSSNPPAFGLRLRRGEADSVLLRRRVLVRCCCSGKVTPIRRVAPGSSRNVEVRPIELKKTDQKVGIQAAPALPFASSQSLMSSRQDKYFPRCTPKNPGPQSRDGPPKRDTGIANEKDWGISLNEHVNESGVNVDGSTWYRESGEDFGENGLRCRWSKMGGQSQDGSSEWKEMWWEKSDWSGYKELGVEKSGRNSEGDSWWETWREVLYQDEWSNLARIERSATKQAKSGTENAGWYENWWEKYDAKGWTEKGAHKYGRLNEQSWWEKWGEHYDGRGSVLKWKTQ